MRLLFILLIVILADLGFAKASEQPRNKVLHQIRNQAEKMYSSKMYFAAIPFYHKIFAKQADSETAWKLSDCYWNLGYYDSALVYIQKSNINSFQTNERLAEYYQRKGDYKTALIYFEKASQFSSFQEKSYILKKRESMLNSSTFLKDSLDWSVNYLSFNTAAREYAPSIFNDQLYFISNRDAGFVVPRTSLTDGLPYDGVFNAGALSYLLNVNPVLVKKQSLVNSSRNLTDLTPGTSNDNNVLQPISLNQKRTPSGNMLPRILKNAVFKGHLGPISIANNASEIYFTRTSRRKINGIFQLEICKSVKKGNRWSTPLVLSINDSLSSSFQPYFDEKNQALYFSSDRLGGQGGADIYKSIFGSDGTWSQPINLGSGINSIKDEGFPTVSGGKLYFASNGWPGLGGVDIFSVDLKQLNSTPKNLGFPVNSSFDDYSIFFSNDNESGYFTSNRYGSDDILAFQYDPQYVTVNSAVTNTITGLRVSGVKVILEQKGDKDNWKELGTYVTDHKGTYSFKVRPNQSNYRFRFLGENISSGELVQYFDTEGVTASKELNGIDLAIHANASEQADTITSNKSEQVALRNSDINNSSEQRTTFRIYHYFNSVGYVLKSHKDLQTVISLMKNNNDLRINIASAADCFGSPVLNLELSKQRAKYIQSLFPSYLQSRIKIAWFGNTRPAKLCNIKNRTFASEQVNRYTEIKIL